MLFCRICGAELDEGARFCRLCGSSVEIQTQTPLRYLKFSLDHWILILIIVSTLFFFLAGYVNQVPWYDDKAYLNNALIHSGRVSQGDIVGPHADERPPLFWWTLTTLFWAEFPIVSAKYLSPFFGVITVVVTGLFARKLFHSDLIGLVAGLFLSFNAYFLLITGMILTDVPGTLLSTLFLLCLYIGVEERRNEFLVVSGPLLALSLMMREQNLIFIPIAIFYVLSRLSIFGKWKVLIALICSALPGLPVLALGLIPTLTLASNALMPLVSGSLVTLPISSVGFSPEALLVFVVLIPVVPVILDNIGFTRKRFQASISVFVSLLLLIVVIYPYLWDNYLLGATFQIQGKGMLSRWIAHEVMSETVGVGAGLTPWARRLWWFQSMPGLISNPFLVYSLIALAESVRKRWVPQLLILLPWIAYTTGFTVFFAYLEARFLISVIPPLAILSAVGLVKVLDWVRLKFSFRVHTIYSQLLGITTAIISFLVANVLLINLFLPTQVGSLSLLDLAVRAFFGGGGWFSSYSTDLVGKLLPPHLNLDVSYVLDSLACLAIVVILPIHILRTDIREELTAATTAAKSFLVNMSILLAVLGAVTIMILNYFSTQVQTYAVALLALVFIYVLAIIVSKRQHK